MNTMLIKTQKPEPIPQLKYTGAIPSKYEYIEKGLDALRNLLLEKSIKSIAIPALGSGNGGLDWQKVKPLIEAKLKDLEVDIQVYEPTADIR